jgi:hypothetical protein
MKIFFAIVGALMIFAGAACGVGGGALAIVAGGDGWIESDTGRIDTPTYALVSEVAHIADEDPDAADFINDLDDFRLRLRAEASDGDEVFIGVGRAGPVSRYLADVDHDVVDDVEFTDLDIDKTLVEGGREPGAPGEQTFWDDSVSGPGRQELDWKIRAGSYRFVIMNADASRGVDVEAQFGIKIPFVTQIAIALLAAAAVLLVLGIVIIVLVARASPSRPPAPPTAQAPPPPHSPPPPAAPPPSSPARAP